MARENTLCSIQWSAKKLRAAMKAAGVDSKGLRLALVQKGRYFPPTRVNQLIEGKANPDLVTAKILAGAVGCTIDDLMDEGE